MRTYFYTLTERGELMHNGVVIDDEKFRDIFFANLCPNQTGIHTDYPFCSPCGAEMNFLRPEDTPYVFTRFDGERLYYSQHGSVVFDPESLAFDDGVLYHRAPYKQWGRLGASVVMELSSAIETWGDWYQLTWHGEPFVIPPRSLPENCLLLRPRRGNHCVGCGRDNPISLHMHALFDCDHLTAETWLRVPEQYSGSLGIMHGGFIALVLDEIMGKVLSGMGVKALTQQLRVEYLRPIPIGAVIYLRAEYKHHRKRSHWVTATAYDPATGRHYASAEAIFVAARTGDTIPFCRRAS